jgi:hypothetical protein
MLICTSEKFVDTKFVIRSRKSKDIPFQMKGVPNTNNDQQNVFNTGKGYGV